MRRVVVTGLGFLTCIGNDKATVTKNLEELNHGIILYPPFKDATKPVKVAAPIKGFFTDSHDPEDWTAPYDLKLSSSTMRGLAPHVFYSYHTMGQALEDSGLSREDISCPETGLFTASSGSGFMQYHALTNLHKRGIMRTSPGRVIGSIVGTLNFNLTASYKIKGSSAGFVSACSSSAHALGYALDEIKLNRQDRMIVVGGEDCSYENFIVFANMRALSTSTDPSKASRPFDRDRNGFVPTGGAVTMILEEESIARKRGAKIYAEFAGWGQATDGYHPTKPHPEGLGLAAAMKKALKSAQLTSESIDYINAHATSTPSGDDAEIRAIKTVFPNTRPAISSTKGLTGHGLSLSSVMESAFSVIAVKDKFIPGSAHIENLDPKAEGLNILRETKNASIGCLISNSSGFGGSNVSLIFKAYS